MQVWTFKKEKWRNLLLESCKTIVIMSLKGFSRENDVSMKNPNVFNIVLPAKHKAQDCWFTESRSLREIVATLLDWPKPKISDSQNVLRFEIWEGFIHICKKTGC